MYCKMKWIPNLLFPAIQSLLASGIMAWAGMRIYQVLIDSYTAVIALTISAIGMIAVYLGMLILLRGLKAEDVRMLPCGEKLALMFKLP